MEKSDTHCLSQVIDVNISNAKSCWEQIPLTCVIRIIFILTFIVIVSKTHNPTLIMRKTSDKVQWRDIPQNTKPVLFKPVEVINHKEMAEKLSQSRES